MNKHCFRLIFNAARGLWMAVAETVFSRGKAAGETSVGPRRAASTLGQSWSTIATLRPITFAMWCALGLVFSSIATAQIVADPNAPARQRPTVLSAPNNVPLINIQTPSAAGVSRNTYQQFDISQQGAILNNSRDNVQTQLGGWVQGNPWLAKGTARIILNEVNSPNTSYLRGYIEVAGQRAQVVVANPNGVTCSGCGFINASRVTMTTGTPVFVGDTFAGYRVQGGAVRIEGDGLNTKTADYTDIITGALQVNATLLAKQLKVIAGSNDVSIHPDTSDPSVTRTLDRNQPKPAYAIDTALLGGMYAEKITLIANELGVGVRNMGTINATAGDFILTSAGKLENSGLITSAVNISAQTADKMINRGNLLAKTTLTMRSDTDIDNAGGTVASEGNLKLSAHTVDNSNAGSLGSGASAEINAQRMHNSGGQVQSGGALTVVLDQTLDNTRGWMRSGGTLSVQADQIINADTHADTLGIAAKNVQLNARLIDNTRGLVSADEKVTLNSSEKITNTTGLVRADRSVVLQGASLTGDGHITSSGDIDIYLTKDFVQSSGSAIEANQRLLFDSTARVINRGLFDATDTFIKAQGIDNLGTGRIYGNHVALSAKAVVNAPENGLAPVIGARDRLDIGAETIVNREHALLFSGGSMSLGGALDSNYRAIGQAKQLNNASATIEALGDLELSAKVINNTNEHFKTKTVLIYDQWIQEFQGEGASQRFPDAHTENVRDSFYQWVIHGTPYENSFRYDYNRKITETQIDTTDPAAIQSGGGMRITADTLNNDKSKIIAGGAITGEIGSLINNAGTGQRITRDNGTLDHYIAHQPPGKYNDWTEIQSSEYQPAPVVETISLGALSYQQNTRPQGTGTKIQVISTKDTGGNVGSVDFGKIVIPDSGLFHQNPNPTKPYIVETDPAFANYRNWLSSDYLLNALSFNSAATQKRLGDGFYEQKLVRDQIAALTGRRFLNGYADDEVQYAALMNNGVSFAQKNNLIPGVSLSAAQMAQLTSDIVWLVEKDITLANGSTAKALVPQLYVMVRAGDLQNNGALISGDSVRLNLSGDLTNQGTIAGRNVVALTAENIQNLGGRITGADVGVTARNDINNVGGTIGATNQLALSAGRDLNVTTTTNTQTSSQGSRTNLDRVAGLYVSGGTGTLIAYAGRNANLTAAEVANQGPGTTAIAAGQQINLGTVKTGEQQAVVWNEQNYKRDANSTETGSRIQTTGALQLSAGVDLNARAAEITSAQGAVNLSAGRDVNLVSGVSETSLDHASRSVSSGSWWSSKEVVARNTQSQENAIASSVSGDRVNISAGRDVQITGSQVVSSAGTAITAARDVNVTAATTNFSESHQRDEKKSGLLHSGGVNITIGTQQSGTNTQATGQRATGSVIGSLEGDVTITAGEKLRQMGSQVIAPQGNVALSGQSVQILEARETMRTQTDSYTSQSGLTIGANNAVLTAAQTVSQMSSAADHTKSDRMKALALAASGIAVATAAEQVVKNPEQMGGVSLSVSVGSSRSDNQSVQTIDRAVGSSVNAGQNVSIRAAGAGAESNVTIQGSTVNAGNTIKLQADNAVQLLAAQNTSDQTSKGSSSSSSLGVSVSTFTKPAASITLSQSKGTTAGTANDVTYTNTNLEAGNTLQMTSGGDTQLRGAVAGAQRVEVNVGGNLQIESLQETSASRETSRTAGASVSLNAGPGSPVGGSLSMGRTNVDSNYQSVVEQTALRAGDAGFAVNVKGNTGLAGGAITSSDRAVDEGKNSLTTGTLTASDLQNSARASATSSGTTLNASLLTDPGNYSAAKAIIGNALNNASESSNATGHTLATISQASVTITDEASQQQRTGKTGAQTVAGINTDANAAQVAVQRQDAESLKRQVEADRAITNQAVQAITTLTDEAFRVMFKEKPKFYKVQCPSGENCTKNPELGKPVPLTGTPEEILKQIAQAEAGAVLAVNGIFNSLERAAQLAMQNAVIQQVEGTAQNEKPLPDRNKPTTIYLMHYEPASNFISELMVGAYETSLAKTLGYTNQDKAYAEALAARGEAATVSQLHSRGGPVGMNAYNILSNQGLSNPNLIAKADGIPVGGKEFTDAAERVIKNADPLKKNIQPSYFANDPVSVGIGGNLGVLTLKDFWNVLSTINSMHSCYGTGQTGCRQVQVLSPNAPEGAVQDNSTLIYYRNGRYENAKQQPVDSRGRLLDPQQ